jgi:hypothetical protein
MREWLWKLMMAEQVVCVYIVGDDRYSGIIKDVRPDAIYLHTLVGADGVDDENTEAHAALEHEARLIVPLSSIVFVDTNPRLKGCEIILQRDDEDEEKEGAAL